MANPETPRLLTVPEAAALLAMSERYVRELVARREIPTVRLGRSVRFSTAALAGWIEQQSR